MDTNFTFGGGLEGIATVEPLVNDYSQYMKIKGRHKWKDRKFSNKWNNNCD